jgi:hypothetical protein
VTRADTRLTSGHIGSVANVDDDCHCCQNSQVHPRTAPADQSRARLLMGLEDQYWHRVVLLGEQVKASFAVTQWIH